MHPEICARARALSMLAHLVPHHHPELRGWFQQFFDETPSCGPDANNPRVFFGTFVCCCCLSGPVKAPHQSSGLVEQYPGLQNVCNLIGLAFFCFFVDFFSYWPHIGVTVGCFWKTSWTTSRKKNPGRWNQWKTSLVDGSSQLSHLGKWNAQNGLRSLKKDAQQWVVSQNKSELVFDSKIKESETRLVVFFRKGKIKSENVFFLSSLLTRKKLIKNVEMFQSPHWKESFINGGEIAFQDFWMLSLIPNRYTT